MTNGVEIVKSQADTPADEREDRPREVSICEGPQEDVQRDQPPIDDRIDECVNFEATPLVGKFEVELGLLVLLCSQHRFCTSSPLFVRRKKQIRLVAVKDSGHVHPCMCDRGPEITSFKDICLPESRASSSGGCRISLSVLWQPSS
jgi:hypothetical protein